MLESVGQIETAMGFIGIINTHLVALRGVYCITVCVYLLGSCLFGDYYLRQKYTTVRNNEDQRIPVHEHDHGERASNKINSLVLQFSLHQASWPRARQILIMMWLPLVSAEFGAGQPIPDGGISSILLLCPLPIKINKKLECCLI